MFVMGRANKLHFPSALPALHLSVCAQCPAPLLQASLLLPANATSCFQAGKAPSLGVAGKQQMKAFSLHVHGRSESELDARLVTLARQPGLTCTHQLELIRADAGGDQLLAASADPCYTPLQRHVN